MPLSDERRTPAQANAADTLQNTNAAGGGGGGGGGGGYAHAHTQHNTVPATPSQPLARGGARGGGIGGGDGDGGSVGSGPAGDGHTSPDVLSSRMVMRAGFLMPLSPRVIAAAASDFANPAHGGNNGGNGAAIHPMPPRTPSGQSHHSHPTNRPRTGTGNGSPNSQSEEFLVRHV